jgi:hypothetical protein
MSETQAFIEWQVYLNGGSKDSGHIRAPVDATPGALWSLLKDGKWVHYSAADDEVYYEWETPQVITFRYDYTGTKYDIRLIWYDIVELPKEKTLKTDKPMAYNRFSLSKEFMMSKGGPDESRKNIRPVGYKNQPRKNKQRS